MIEDRTVSAIFGIYNRPHWPLSSVASTSVLFTRSRAWESMIMFLIFGPVVPMATSMDPFEVRMQFLSLIRKLNASVVLSSRSTLT